MHCAPFGKVAGQRSPLTATAQQVQHRAEHFVQVYRSGFGLAPHRLKHRQNHGKLFATDIDKLEYISPYQQSFVSLHFLHNLADE